MKRSVLLMVFVFAGCTSAPKKAADPSQEVIVMSFNLENLFDTVPDEGREDATFISKTFKGTPQHRLTCAKQSSPSRMQECLEKDWNEAVLQKKMERLATVILGVNGGRGPDILITVETENLRVLKMLNEKYLEPAGYGSVVLLEGPDLRGIDIGMLSRFPVDGEAKLQLIEFQPKNDEDKEWMARSRGILQTTFKLPSGDLLTVMGVHFPSQANPTYWREQSIATLNKMKSQLPKDRLVIAAGDFNISAEEDNREGLYRDNIGKEWLVSHYIGCRGCDGTHNYRGGWSFLDAILFSPNFGPQGSAPWQVDGNSVQVVKNSRFQTSVFNSPARFDENSPVGVSDHYPIKAKIVRRPLSGRQQATNTP